MRQDDHCDMCSLVLEAACQSEGEKFCQLKEEYWTTDMSADDMYAILADITSSPEQLERIDEQARRLAASGWRPPDKGEMAAQRWLQGYRNGKG